MRLFAVFLLLSLMTGCASDAKSYALPGDYAPLEAVRERSDMLELVVDGPWITTIGAHLYVEDVDDWLLRNPPGSAQFVAKLRHEQVHSARQHARGVYLWLSKYSYDKKFAWEEESVGWYAEIEALRGSGVAINRQALAVTLSRYENLSGRLISYADALRWVDDVLAGRWKPPGQ